MLTEERYQYILEYLQEHGSVTVAELTGQLGASESTIRRDLNALGNLGKLSKVHGGATALHLDFSYVEHPIETKSKLYVEEKRRIGQYAAQTIRKDDFLFLDAGTTTGMMIDYITEAQHPDRHERVFPCPAAGAAGVQGLSHWRADQDVDGGRRRVGKSAGHCAVPFYEVLPRRQRHRPDQRVHDAGPGRGECQASRRPAQLCDIYSGRSF